MLILAFVAISVLSRENGFFSVLQLIVYFSVCQLPILRCNPFRFKNHYARDLTVTVNVASPLLFLKYFLLIILFVL